MELGPLPSAGVDAIIGLLERLNQRGGREDLFRLAHELRLSLDDLMPAIDAAQLLGFVSVREGDVELTSIGVEMASADIAARKRIFRQQMTALPLMRTLLEMLTTAPGHRLRRDFVLAQLRRTLSEKWAERTIETIVKWGRYAELIGYKARTGELYLAE